jgi:hypothetical protein
MNINPHHIAHFIEVCRSADRPLLRVEHLTTHPGTVRQNRTAPAPGPERAIGGWLSTISRELKRSGDPLAYHATVVAKQLVPSFGRLKQYVPLVTA